MRPSDGAYVLFEGVVRNHHEAKAVQSIFYDAYRPMAERLVNTQRVDGSWMGDQVGTSYGTGIALIILGLPYQYVPIYQR